MYSPNYEGVIFKILNPASNYATKMMTICKNGKEYPAEFNLVDRSNFNYPVLLGISFLKGVALVDANETFLFKSDLDPCLTKSGSTVP